MMARSNSDYFNTDNYTARYFDQLNGHRKLLKQMIESGISPWSVNDRGDILEEAGTAGYFARNAISAICWIYKTKVVPGVENPPLDGSEKFRDLRIAVPAGKDYNVMWINPWSGAIITTQTLPGTMPPEGEWIGKVIVWDARMEKVDPSGFDERQQEDVFLILQVK